MNEIQIFESSEFGQVRSIEVDGEFYFVGKDVAEILGYKNTRTALVNHVDEDDKADVLLQDGRQNRTMITINESGLYSLILSSKLPTAKKFKKWVTSEVLPSIRKNGAYMTKEKVAEMLLNPDSMIELLQNLKQEQAKVTVLTDTVAIQNQKIEELQPKASYYDLVLNCKDLVSVTVMAKDFGWSAVKLNKFLQEKKIQFKQNDIWLLYQKYAEKGYTSTKINTYNSSDGTIKTRSHTHWTQKGRLFIYDLLKSNGVLPTIEREQSVIEIAQ